MTDQQRDRYARHLLLPGFGAEAQEKLLNSRVLLIGAGGLGSPTALYLVAAGIGNLTIIDHDTVDLSNLQRQILHRESDLGQPKVRSAQRELEALNSNCRLTLLEEPFTAKNAEELIADHDLVIDGSDNFTTRFLANDACYFGKKPLVYGSIFQFEGQLTLFDQHEQSPCYRCLVPQPPADGAVPNCLEAGVIGTLPGIIGSLQAMEAIKYLTGLGTPPRGKLVHYDALQTSFRELTINKDPHCPLCSADANIHSITSEAQVSCQLEGSDSITALELQSISEEILLLDVREAAEFALGRIPGSQLTPLSQLKTGAIPALPFDHLIYVHCKAGTRSAQAIKILKEAGYSSLVNISDGYDGWAKIKPT